MSRRFPYADRAAAARSAMAEIGPAFARVRRRNDREDPDTKALLQAIRQAYAAIDAAYAPEFHDAMIALRRGDVGTIDPLIEFLEADPIFFRSGYVKEYVLDRIKAAPFSAKQAERLRSVLLRMVDTRDCREFRRYCRLARYVDGGTLRADLTAKAAAADEGMRRRANWVLEALDGADRQSRRGRWPKPKP